MLEYEKFIEVDGYHTRYYDAGNGEPILLVSGGEFGTSTAAEAWNLNFDDLAKDYRVIAVDKLGQGMTDNPRTLEDYVLESAITHLEQFIEALAIGPVHIVGHSRGGYEVTRVAVDRPDLVRSLTIVDSGTLTDEYSPYYGRVAEQSAHITDPREKYTFEVSQAAYDPATMVTPELVDSVVAYLTTPKYQEARENNALARPALRRDYWEKRAILHEQIRDGGLKDMPVLVVWAYNDEGAPLKQTGFAALDLILANVPRSSFHIVNRAGHYAFREQPAEFNATLRVFLASV